MDAVAVTSIKQMEYTSTTANLLKKYAIEELRTEIASAMTSQQLGIPSTEKQMQRNLDLHKAYIQGWAQAIQNAPKGTFRRHQGCRTNQ